MSDGKFKVFISFRNTEEKNEIALANDIYDRLSSKGIKTFFSKESVIKYGKSEYLDLITTALDESVILVIIASSIKNLTSEFIKFEWKSFLNEILSNRKPNGEIFLLLNGMSTSELPYDLRAKQNFGVNQIDELIEIIINSLNKNVSRSKNEQMSVSEFNHSNLVNSNDYGVLRKPILNFVNNFLLTDLRCCFLYGETGIGVTSFFINFVKKFTNNTNIIFAKNYSQFSTFLAETRLNINEISYIIIDNIHQVEELEKISNILLDYLNIKVIASISIELEKKLYKYISDKIFFTTYQIPYLSEEEIYTYLNSQLSSSEQQILESVDLYQLLINSQINYLKKPSTLRLIINAIRSKKFDFKNFTILQIFELIENNVEEKELEDRFLKFIYENKDKLVNGEAYPNRNELNTLCELGILVNDNNYFRFKDEKYFDYKIAKLLYVPSNKYYELSLFPIDFITSLPYYVAYCYSCGVSLKNFNFTNTKVIYIYELFDILLNNEKSLLDICENDILKEYILDYAFSIAENGYYVTVYMILNTVEKYNIFLHEDSEAIRFITKYYELGMIDYLPTNKSVRYKYYLSLLEYYMDQYKSSLQYIKKTLYTKCSSILKLNIEIHYLDVLIDYGSIQKAEKLANKLFENKEILTSGQSGHLVNIIGYILMCKGSYLEALNHYKETVFLLQNDNLNNILAKTYGDIAIVNLYLGKYTIAEESILKNIEICEANDNYNGLAASNEIYSKILFVQKKYKDALKCLYNALIYSISAKNKWRMIRIKLFINIINSLLGKKLYDSNNIIQEINKIDSNDFWPVSYALLALSLFEIGNPLSLKYVKEALKGTKYVNEVENREFIKCISKLILNGNIGNTSSEYINSFFESYKHLKTCDQSSFNTFVPNTVFVVDDFSLIKPSSLYCEDIYKYSSNFEATKYMLWNSHRNIYDTITFISKCLKKEKTCDYLVWLITINDIAIGTIDMTFNEKFNCYELGYILSPDYWGKGIMTKVSRKVINYFFEMGQTEVLGIVYDENIASKRVLEKLNFEYIRSQINTEGIKENIYICRKK